MQATCSSCHLGFSNPDEQRIHYKSELHRFNLKRKVAQLPPVTLEYFNQKISPTQTPQDPNQKKAEKEIFYECTSCGKRYNSKNAYDQHLQAKKHKEEYPDAEAAPKIIEKQPQQPQQPPQPQPTAPSATQPQPPQQSEVQPQSREEEMQDGEKQQPEQQKLDEYEQQVEEFIQNKLKAAKKLELEDCLFCNNKSENLLSNLSHMSSGHGLFIPDMEYLTNLEGLIGYLGEKISIGNFCLFCNKGFSSLEATQAHMRDASHCKIFYDGEEAEEEFEDFYDFSLLQGGEKQPAGEIKSKVRVSENGMELIFEDGKIVGHRSLLIYYKQRYRRTDDRDSVLVNKQRLLALGWGSHGNSTALIASNAAARSSQIAALSHPKEMSRKDNEWKMKTGINGNRLQKHYRYQIDF